MSAAVISLLFALGASTWVYTKFQSRGGNENTKQSVVAAAVSGLIIFFVLWSILSLVLK
jgi:hypothetical protein